ncbi:uncharacterized protein LOC135145442 [Zophobas morio]|uniref:uncharacterized protein LOC135145442 n=1 Tax=Zophobas morio TaxID=2755281 RepID=UPI0030837088
MANNFRHLELCVVNVLPDKGLFPSSEKYNEAAPFKDITECFSTCSYTFFCHVLLHSVTRLVQLHYSLKRLKIAGIPMKSTSLEHCVSLYDVVILLQADALDCFFREPLVHWSEEECLMTDKTVFWPDKRSSKLHGDALCVRQVRRATSLKVTSGPSSCMLKHIFFGRLVVLHSEDRIPAFVFKAAEGVLYLHELYSPEFLHAFPGLALGAELEGCPSVDYIEASALSFLFALINFLVSRIFWIS